MRAGDLCMGVTSRWINTGLYQRSLMLRTRPAGVNPCSRAPWADDGRARRVHNGPACRTCVRGTAGTLPATSPDCERVTVSTEVVAGGTPGDDATRPAAPRVTVRGARKPAASPAASPVPPDDTDAREELRRAAARLALVHEIDRAILAAESTTEIADRAAERLRQLAGASRVSISAIDTTLGVLTVLAFSQEDGGAGFAAGMTFPLEGTLDPRVLDEPRADRPPRPHGERPDAALAALRRGRGLSWRRCIVPLRRARPGRRRDVDRRARRGRRRGRQRHHRHGGRDAAARWRSTTRPPASGWSGPTRGSPSSTRSTGRSSPPPPPRVAGLGRGAPADAARRGVGRRGRVPRAPPGDARDRGGRGGHRQGPDGGRRAGAPGRRAAPADPRCPHLRAHRGRASRSCPPPGSMKSWGMTRRDHRPARCRRRGRSATSGSPGGTAG